MQPGPDLRGLDFTRFSHIGHRWRLFRRFAEIESGAIARMAPAIPTTCVEGSRSRS